MRTIALIGQSLLQQWTPANMASFVAELLATTGETFSVVNAAQGGAGLLNPTNPGQYWHNFSSTLVTSFTAQIGPSVNLAAVLMDVGQQDAYGPGVTSRQFLSALVDLYALICSTNGKVIGDIPFLIVPLGNPVALKAPFARAVLAAEYEVGRVPGMFVGPETWDFPTQADGIHLADYGAYAIRAADAIATVFGKAPVAPAGPAFATSVSTTVPGRSSIWTLSNSNQTAASTAAGSAGISTDTPLSGKQVFRFLLNAGVNADVGIGAAGAALGFPGGVANTYGLGGNGVIYPAATAGPFSFTAGMNIDVAVDSAAGKMWFGHDGTWFGDPAGGTSAAVTFTPGTYYPMVGDIDSASAQTLTGPLLVPAANVPAGYSNYV